MVTDLSPDRIQPSHHFSSLMLRFFSLLLLHSDQLKMASFSAYSTLCNIHSDSFVSFSSKLFCNSNFRTSFFGFKLTGKPIALSNRYILRSKPVIAASTSNHTFDVVIIGAGIIGLSIARQFLISSDLSVAVIDKAVPCSGATGAGN